MDSFCNLIQRANYFTLYLSPLNPFYLWQYDCVTSTRSVGDILKSFCSESVSCNITFNLCTDWMLIKSPHHLLLFFAYMFYFYCINTVTFNFLHYWSACTESLHTAVSVQHLFVTLNIYTQLCQCFSVTIMFLYLCCTIFIVYCIYFFIVSCYAEHTKDRIIFLFL